MFRHNRNRRYSSLSTLVCRPFCLHNPAKTTLPYDFVDERCEINCPQSEYVWILMALIAVIRVSWAFYTARIWNKDTSRIQSPNTSLTDKIYRTTFNWGGWSLLPGILITFTVKVAFVLPEWSIFVPEAYLLLTESKVRDVFEPCKNIWHAILFRNTHWQHFTFPNMNKTKTTIFLPNPWSFFWKHARVLSPLQYILKIDCS